MSTRPKLKLTSIHDILSPKSKSNFEDVGSITKSIGRIQNNSKERIADPYFETGNKLGGWDSTVDKIGKSSKEKRPRVEDYKIPESPGRAKDEDYGVQKSEKKKKHKKSKKHSGKRKRQKDDTDDYLDSERRERRVNFADPDQDQQTLT